MAIIIPILISLSAILISLYLFFYIQKQSPGNERMVEISEAIKTGANAYLKRQNIYLGIFALIMALILFFSLGKIVALSYLLGAFLTSLAAFFGMSGAVRANVRTANAARENLSKALTLAYFGGAIMGLGIVGVALFGVSFLYFLFNSVLKNPELALDSVLGFSFGASTLSLFAKAGGGIYTKTADIGADLVGKVELGIPEDDPRNPAVIADNVGDNVGDVAGMGADLTDSYIAGIVATMLLGASLFKNPVYIILPLLIESIGIISSILGILTLKIKTKDPGSALNRATYFSCLIFAIFLFFLLKSLSLGKHSFGIFFTTLAGLVAGILMGLTTDFFTSIDKGPVKKTAEASKTGAATNILSGFSYGILSIVPGIVGICLAILISWNISKKFELNPFYGISMAAVGMLATLGSVIASDAYGPIADNAKGIAEQSGLGKEVIEIVDKLDAAGNTTKAISKGFAIGAAALQVISLFFAYSVAVGIPQLINLMDPKVLIGVFVGGMMPPIICALLILAVGKNAFRMVEEVRRQFKEIPGLLEGKSKPDYKRCVDIATKGALKELIPSGILAIIVPLIIGFALGKESLAGFLGGSIITGIIFALFMANAGALWDNAKKYIEEGNFGGKGSEAHKAAVTGDTVGDPFKDTAGPTINTMITVMALVATVFVPLILKFTLLK
jgi:K(+)-stimulated pyrophosphate-energized sodium pump